MERCAPAMAAALRRPFRSRGRAEVLGAAWAEAGPRRQGRRTDAPRRPRAQVPAAGGGRCGHAAPGGAGRRRRVPRARCGTAAVGRHAACNRRAARLAHAGSAVLRACGPCLRRRAAHRAARRRGRSWQHGMRGRERRRQRWGRRGARRRAARAALHRPCDRCASAARVPCSRRRCGLRVRQLAARGAGSRACDAGAVCQRGSVAPCRP